MLLKYIASTSLKCHDFLPFYQENVKKKQSKAEYFIYCDLSSWQILNLEIGQF